MSKSNKIRKAIILGNKLKNKPKTNKTGCYIFMTTEQESQLIRVIKANLKK